MKIKMKPIAAAMALSLATGQAFAIDYYLAAKAYTKTLPDGTTVPMWGYVEDTGGTCFNAADNATRQACIDGLGDPQAQGPRLVIPPAQTALRVYLSNGLPEPTSLIIPGQKLPIGNYPGIAPVSGPTWDDGTTGGRSSISQRVRSFVPEAPASGGKMGYIWNSGNAITPTQIDDNGTLIYHSGTWPQKQVYMGLAGLVTHDAAAGSVYSGVSYDNDVTLFYSDIDPAFNAAVAAGTLETAVDRHPTWFLVNGEPFHTGIGDITNGTSGPLSSSSNTLLRFASTASDTHVVVMQGMDMTIHGEDGNQYTWQSLGVSDPGAGTPAPRKQYSVMMTPAKTKDAMIIAPAIGRYAVYDGDGYMTNPSDPADETVGDTLGGMIRFLAFGGGTNDAPTANDDSFSVVAGLTATISPLTNDTDPEGDPLYIANPSAATAGTVTCNTVDPSGTCDFDATGLISGDVATFTYEASDGSLNSAAATVTVTVTDNLPPTGVADAATTDEGVPVDIIVTANDTDPEGQPLSVSTFDATSVNAGTVSCTVDTCTYTPAAGFTGEDTFTYVVNDGVNDSAATTVTVTVNAIVPPNAIPVAVDDTATTTVNNQVNIDVLANDTDADAGATLTIASHDATSANGGTIGCATGVAGGTCTYTPATDFTGTDTFGYVVTDGTDSANGTVTVTVDPAGAPILYFSTIGAGSVPTVSGPYDDADIYTVDAGGAFTRATDGVSDLGLPNNADIDGMSIIGGTTYLSFAAASTSVTGLGSVPDEDVVAYDGTTWTTFFDGSVCGLDSSNGQDIDAISVVGTTLYFSIAGSGNNNPVSGVNGAIDDADVYSWTVGDTSCAKVIDARANNGLGLQANADIDGLTTTDGVTFYVSFRASTNVPGLGTVQDESVVYFNGNSWSMFFSGAGQLDGANSQNIDAIQVP
ncbi:MAG: Ig-like domain-containing protein [Candidatus Thiodiazotropha sp.]